MDNSFGGMPEDEFFLGYDAMIDEDDPDSINYDPREHSGYKSNGNSNRTYYGGGCCCIALLPILFIFVAILLLII